MTERDGDSDGEGTVTVKVTVKVTVLLCALAALLGVFGWRTHASLCALPLLALLWAAAPGRIAAALVIACYYLAGSAVLPATWAVFFGEQGSPASGVLLWIASALLLAAPWALAWPPAAAGPLRIGASLLLALAAVSLPPLGVIGWLNPLLAAGSLFAGAGWAGLAANALLMTALALAVRSGGWRQPWPRALTLPATLLVMSILVAAAPATEAAGPVPAGWVALDTALGRTPVDYAATVARQVALIETVTRAVRAAPAGSIAVLVLPEQSAGHWTAAQQAVWRRLFDPGPPGIRPPRIVFGASVSEAAVSGAAVSGTPVSGTTVTGTTVTDTTVTGTTVSGTMATAARAGRLRNVVIVDPLAASILAASRQPVPFGMWRPWQAASYEAHWTATGVAPLDGERVLWSICYDDYLVWPFLLSFAFERPTLIVSIANGWWVRGSGQDRLQAMHVQAWGRLFGLPVLRAVNR